MASSDVAEGRTKNRFKRNTLLINEIFEITAVSLRDGLIIS